MTSSLQALRDAVTPELGMNTCEHLLIESANGHVNQRRVEGFPVVIRAVFDHRETMGRCLFFIKDCTNLVAAGVTEAAA